MKVIREEPAPAFALLRRLQTDRGVCPALAAAAAAAMGPWAPLLSLLALLAATAAQTHVCSVDKTVFEVLERENRTEPLVDIRVPQDQEVTLGPLSTPHAFRIQGSQLFLNVTPDYEENKVLRADLECRRDGAVVTQLRVLVTVLNVNDNAPCFPFETKLWKVPEDTKVNSTIIPESQLKAEDRDEDPLFYALQEVTPGASDFFSLVGENEPNLRLDQPLDFDRWPNMTLKLLVRDTRDENVVPSHTANATLVLEVLPADLRPPWFLPCAYNDAHVCVQAWYHGEVPTGHRLPGPLALQPGPIYAVDGDGGIGQRILYSIAGGNEGGLFAIDANSGNLTMTGSVPSPKTFRLLVKGEQADHARYSVTQVTVEARDTRRPPSFPLRLYRGFVVLGWGAGADLAVKDAADPSQPLTLRAKDPEFPDFDGAFTYRVTNNSHFRMDGEAVLITPVLAAEGVYYAEVEAQNSMTSRMASTVLEVRVSQAPSPTPAPPALPTPPEAGGTTGPSGSTSAEAPSTPGTSGGSSTTSSGGSPGPHPSSGTSLRPSTMSTSGGSPSAGTSTSPTTALPRTEEARTSGASQSSASGLVTTPGGAGDNEAGGSLPGDRRFSAAEMGALGGVLGALLLLALMVLGTLLQKHYGHRLRCCAHKALEPPPPGGYDNQAFLADSEANWAPAPSPSPDPSPAQARPTTPEHEPPEAPMAPSSVAPGRVPRSPVVAGDGDSPAAVRSILTKERRPEGGYKAVWFGEDIRAEADVAVNVPTPDEEGTGDSGGGDVDALGATGSGDGDSTYI